MKIRRQGEIVMQVSVIETMKTIYMTIIKNTVLILVCL